MTGQEPGTERDERDERDEPERDGGTRTLLRAVMEERTAATPVPPPWPRLEKGLRKVRRRRRARVAGKVGAGLLAVAAAGALVQTNTVPYPSWATVTMPASGGESALSGTPTRGSLAGDEAWLDGFRRAVADAPADEESGGEVWAPPSAGGVDVIFAGDVAGQRLALVEGDWHWGLLAARQQVWYQGRTGAAPGEMEKSQNGSPEDTPVFTNQGLIDDAGPAGQIVVVAISARPTDIRLRRPPIYGADGSVTLQEMHVERSAEGVHQAVIREPGTFELIVPGVDWEQQLSTAGLEASDIPLAGLPPALHGGTVPPDDLQAALLYGQLASDLPLGTSERRLMWAGTLDGRRFRIVAVTAANGAIVLSALEQQGTGRDVGTYVLAGAVLPKGSLERAAFAWPVPAAGADGFDPRPGGTVAAMGPAGAVSAEFLDDSGRAVATAALTDGFGTAAAAGAVSVRFTDAEGGAAGEAPVRPLLSLGETLYGNPANHE